jgi:hypothetical protein
VCAVKPGHPEKPGYLETVVRRSRVQVSGGRDIASGTACKAELRPSGAGVPWDPLGLRCGTRATPWADRLRCRAVP